MKWALEIGRKESPLAETKAFSSLMRQSIHLNPFDTALLPIMFKDLSVVAGAVETETQFEDLLEAADVPRWRACDISKQSTSRPSYPSFSSFTGSRVDDCRRQKRVFLNQGHEV